MKTLREGLQEYLAMRRALGFKLRAAGANLDNFVSFLEREGATRISTELALRWAQQPEGVQPACWAHRLRYVRGLAKFWSATDPQTDIPPLGLLPHRYPRARPYLYTDEEIRHLLHAAKQLPPTGSLRPWTYYTLFGLLAVTGLRISEALALRDADIDGKEAVLTIRGTKFGKSRLVPVQPSTQKALSDYQERRDRLLAGRPALYFLVSRRGTRLDDDGVRRTFYRLSRQIGLRAPAASHGPRLHDFGHRFAVETLLGWYRSGQDVERRLPVLSTYLGHVQVSDTYWYLSACPELMGLAIERLERHWEVLS